VDACRKPRAEDLPARAVVDNVLLWDESIIAPREFAQVAVPLAESPHGPVLGVIAVPMASPGELSADRRGFLESLASWVARIAL
jgi:hypothetical protein